MRSPTCWSAPGARLRGREPEHSRHLSRSALPGRLWLRCLREPSRSGRTQIPPPGNFSGVSSIIIWQPIAREEAYHVNRSPVRFHAVVEFRGAGVRPGLGRPGCLGHAGSDRLGSAGPGHPEFRAAGTGPAGRSGDVGRRSRVPVAGQFSQRRGRRIAPPGRRAGHPGRSGIRSDGRAGPIAGRRVRRRTAESPHRPGRIAQSAARRAIPGDARRR